MSISAKGRTGLRMMVVLGQATEGEYISLRTITQKQGISYKYLERLIPSMVKSGLVESMQGKNGGYRLTRRPEDINVAEILVALEGPFESAPCQQCYLKPELEKVCPVIDNCKIIHMWKGYDKITTEYFESVSLADVCR
ncbi:MAG: Rrf2 family transcriptional regulator [Lachnospiraceae bacterium]|nr:Rrf2 family transcriptional regulator [Lachnospiraceae bacterium]